MRFVSQTAHLNNYLSLTHITMNSTHISIIKHLIETQKGLVDLIKLSIIN